jgi:undecaprenyl diphosphate synthase
MEFFKYPSSNIQSHMTSELVVPKHIAFIPDGNRRWAKQRGLDPWEGHYKGAENIESLVRRAQEYGGTHMTFWGSSEKNLHRRPMQEKKALLDVYETYFHKLIESDVVHRDKIRINVIGKWREQLPSTLTALLEEGIEKTKDYDGPTLTFMLAYNGTTEMLEAIKSIHKAGYAQDEITQECVKENLWTHDLPPVDLLIRTGGEPHLSVGFMMWDIADAQLFFSDKYFPDFSADDLSAAIEEYSRRERRHGC